MLIFVSVVGSLIGFPVWVCVMSLFVVAWAVWYVARMWDVPADFA